MTSDNHCDRAQQASNCAVSRAQAHALIALEQSALYAARLAISRWINSSFDVMPIPDAALPKAAWYAQTQQNFQEWLGRGGFAQYEVACGEQFAAVIAEDADLVQPVPDSGASTADSCVE
jgi:glutamine phosphoribosylpyrophosphate amidotransferase